MKKLKDFIYDYNDILLAILIIIIAAAVIFVKVSDIMEYPSFAKEAQKQTQQNDVDFTDVDLSQKEIDPMVEPGDDIVSGENNEDPQNNPQPENPPQQPENNQGSSSVVSESKFEVKQGDYFSTAAKKLYEAGLIKDSAKFIEMVKSMGLENKLQIGIFTIPAGSSEEDIAKIITKTNR